MDVPLPPVDGLRVPGSHRPRRIGSRTGEARPVSPSPLPTPTSRTPHRRVVRRSVVVRSVSVVSAVVVALVGTLTVVLVGASRAEASSCTDPGGQLRVVVVVDAGDGPSATCLVVPVGTTGSQVLARRAAELGLAAPRYAGSGLLCAIDGVPAPPACGDRNAGGYRYWAYFNGSTGSWVYGSINPFTRRLSDGDIEGWRFVDGAGNGSDPPPRIAPSRSLFPAVVATANVPSSGAAVVGPSSAPDGPSTGGATTPGSEAVDASAVAVSGTIVPTVGSADVGGPVELEVATVGSRPASSGWIAIAVVTVMIAALAVGAVLRNRGRT